MATSDSDSELTTEFDGAVAESLEDRAVKHRSLFSFLRLLLQQYGLWSPSVDDIIDVSNSGIVTNFFLGPFLFIWWVWSYIRYSLRIVSGRCMERVQLWSVKRWLRQLVSRVAMVPYIGGLLFWLVLVVSVGGSIAAAVMVSRYPGITIPIILVGYTLYLGIEYGGVASFTFTENWLWGLLLTGSVGGGLIGIPQAFGFMVLVGTQELWGVVVVGGLLGVFISLSRVVRRDITELAQFTLRREYELAHPVNLWILPFPFRPLVWVIASRVSALGALLLVLTAGAWSNTVMLVVLTIPFIVGGAYLVKRSVAFLLVSLLPEDHTVDSSPVAEE